MSIAEIILNVAIPLLSAFLILFWSKLKGYKTYVLGIVTVLLGILTSIDSTVVDFFAGILKMAPEKIQSLLLAVIAFINIIFRKFSDSPAGALMNLPAALKK